MITDKDVADKENDVKMLRLQIAEHKARRRLNEIEQSELNDVLPPRNELTDFIRAQNKALKDFQDEINKKDTTIKEMKSKVEPPNLAVMVLLHNLNAKTEALEADLKASHTNNAALSKALEEANTTLYNAKNAVEGLEADLSNSKSAIMMKNGVINDRVEHLERVYNQLHGFQDDVYEKNKTIDELTEQRDSEYETAKALRRVIDEIEQDVTKYKTTINGLNETISDLRMAASDMLDTINECSRRDAEDSRVLMQVVEIVKEWGRLSAMVSTYDMRHLRDLLVDYLDAPETPVVTLKTPSMGTRVVSKNEETHIINEAKMRAVHALIGCGDKWVLHLGVDAVEVAKYNQTIDELTETTRKLEGRLSSMYAANSDQDTTINKLNALLADEKMTLAAYRSNPLSDQVADRDKRIEQLMVLNEALRIDIDDHIAVQDRIIDGLEETLKLERIDHTAEMSAVKKTLHETIKGLRSRMAGARIIIDNQATSIEELTKDLDARNTVIKDFKAIEQKETDRLHKIIEGNGKIIDELNDMYCDVCGKLEQIAKVTKDAISYVHIDEITKIIQEE